MKVTFSDMTWSSSSIVYVMPTGKRTTREHSKSCGLYSALAAPENSWRWEFERPPTNQCYHSKAVRTAWRSVPLSHISGCFRLHTLGSSKSRAPSTSTCGNASRKSVKTSILKPRWTRVTILFFSFGKCSKNVNYFSKIPTMPPPRKNPQKWHAL